MRVVLVLALVGAAMAAPKDEGRIMGGSPTTIEEYNFIVGMLHGYHGTNHILSCGGTLITRTAATSAAHCYAGHIENQWRVRAGSTYALSGGTILEISRIIRHANYHPRLMVNDIAIIRLKTPVTLSAQIGTARIAGPNYQLPDHTTVYAAGWGRTAPGAMGSNVLQHVDVNVINQNICISRYAWLKTISLFRNWPDITPEMLCLGILHVGGKDTCQGDSGGPAVHQGDILVGITSWGFSCGTFLFPGVYVRVSSYTSWIYDNSVL